jgi:tripartite-type tricarboxylate transporter receptor subunit TctC
MLWTLSRAGLAGLACAATLTGPAAADAVGDFYKGKRMQLYVGTTPGGEYDTQSRLVSRHLGKHIPGNPGFVVQNMPGGGGIKMALWLYNVPAKDGTHMGVIGNNFPAMQAVGHPSITIDFTRLNWIGAIAPVVETLGVWHTAGVSKFEDLKTTPIIAGATGTASITYLYPTIMNKYLGTKIKVVHGYSGGSIINAALEKGEVQARNNSWSSWKATKAQWLKEGKIKVIVQAGPKAKDLNVPSLEELATDDNARKIIGLVVSGAYLGRPLALTPGVPADRVKAMRQAFIATMKDSAFQAEAKRMRFDLDAIGGEDMQAYVAKLMTFPKALVPQARELIR